MSFTETAPKSRVRVLADKLACESEPGLTGTQLMVGPCETSLFSEIRLTYTRLADQSRS